MVFTFEESLVHETSGMETGMCTTLAIVKLIIGYIMYRALVKTFKSEVRGPWNQMSARYSLSVRLLVTSFGWLSFSLSVK